MAILLFLLGAVAFMISIGLFSVSQTAIHEILAAVFGLAACVLIGCGGIVDAVNDVSDKLKEPKQ